MNARFYQVGGCVRDSIMGLKSKDIDFSVEAESYEHMKEAIIARGCDIKVEKPEFVTIRAIDKQLGGVDFVLCRKEGAYSDGRRPDSVEIGTLKDDLSRRDFTCNAIAMNDEGKIIDPFNGRDAIKSRTLTCVGNASARLTEDSLRMLRAIRFAITKGFNLDKDLVDFLSDIKNSALLNNVSQERIREELNKCFAFNTLITLNYFQKFPGICTKVFFDGTLTLEATLKKR